MTDYAKGWLTRQLNHVTNDVQAWPEWMKRASGLHAQPGCCEKAYPPAMPKRRTESAGAVQSAARSGGTCATRLRAVTGCLCVGGKRHDMENQELRVGILPTQLAALIPS